MRYIFVDGDIVVNGTFDSDLTNWTGVNWAWETDGSGGGWARHTTGSATAMAANSPTVTAGKSYVCTFLIGGRTAGTIRLNIGGTSGTNRSANGIFTEILVATTTAVPSVSPSSTFDGYVDNVIINEIQFVSGSHLDTSVRLKI